jgi:Flp pilus assembly protein TadB
MRWIVATLVAGAVLWLSMWRPGGDLVDRIGPFLDRRASQPEDSPRRRVLPESVRSAAPWAVVGAFAGLLLAQGDLFVSGPGGPAYAMAALGGVCGYLLWRVRDAGRRRRRERRYRLELPVITDAIAMQIVSGESVGTSLERIVAGTDGEVPDALERVLGRTRSGSSIPSALLAEAGQAPHPDGRRLLESLAHAHTHGGRLGDSLTDLSTDFRAGIERDLTSEGGRRAVAAHGPVLALMIPTALLFLLYPTLLGLRALAGSP